MKIRAGAAILSMMKHHNLYICVCVQSLSLRFVSEIHIYLGELWEIHTFPSWNPTFSCINPEFCCLNHQEYHESPIFWTRSVFWVQPHPAQVSAEQLKTFMMRVTRTSRDMRNKVEMATVLANMERDHVRQGDRRKIVRGEFQISNLPGWTMTMTCYDEFLLICLYFSWRQFKPSLGYKLLGYSVMGTLKTGEFDQQICQKYTIHMRRNR